MSTLSQLQGMLGNSIADGWDMLPYVPVIVCQDGFCISMQASKWHYCAPRDNEGPWVKVELGFPSYKEDLLMEYAEDPSNPTKTVYGYVPLELVAQVTDKHGGICHQ